MKFVNKQNLIIGTNYSFKYNAIKTQGEYLHELLVENNIPSQIVSDFQGFLKRITHSCLAILRLKSGQNIIIQVYGTKSLYLEWLCAFIGKMKGHYVVLTLHGGDIPEMYFNSKIKRFFFNGLFGRADLITAPSEYLFIELEKRGAGLVGNSLKVIRNFIDLDEYCVENNKKLANGIFWMRAFHEVYDPILALHCLQELLKSGYDFKLYMAGPDKGFLNATIEEIKRLDLENNVICLGKIDNAKKCEIASKCLLYLNTTKIDNSPVTFLEMMALGLPIVSTNVGGIKYWVENNKNALLTELNNAIELSDKIKLLHDNHIVFENIKSNNFLKVKEFSKDNVLMDWLSILQLSSPTN
jgi:glycosyltransferase involved in cell wall biosynthesis